VRKRGREEYPGLIVSVFTNRAGPFAMLLKWIPHFRGQVDIFEEEQLELRS
jgi:hypothetical protein